MPEVLLLIAGFLAGLIGAMSGGGGAVIPVFTLLYLGMPINQAIATNRLGNLGFFLPALRNFTKAKQVDKKALPAIIALTVVGTAAGTALITSLNAEIFGKIVAAILIVVVLASFMKKSHGTKQRPPKAIWPYAYFGASVASGAVGAGTGVLSTLTLMYCRGFTALQSLGHYFYANAIGSFLSVGMLLSTGLINYRYALWQFIGSLFGAHLGSHIALRRGNEFVRLMTKLVAISVAAKLLLG